MCVRASPYSVMVIVLISPVSVVCDCQRWSQRSQKILVIIADF